MDMLPEWPSLDTKLEDCLTALIRDGYFENWPPSDSVSFYLQAMLGYPKEFIEDFVEYSCKLSKATLRLISEYAFHSFSADRLCNFVGDCIRRRPSNARVRT